MLNDRNVTAWPFSEFGGLLQGPLQGSDAEPRPVVATWLYPVVFWYCLAAISGYEWGRRAIHNEGLNQLTSVANSAPHTSAAWPSPSSALFLSYLRPSSFLTWTTAQEPHWSPFLHHHLFKSIIFTTSREDFSHIHTRSHHYSAPDFTESCPVLHLPDKMTTR